MASTGIDDTWLGRRPPLATAAPAPLTYPMSFAQATEQGLADTIDWGTRCDTSTGKLAVPDFFAQPCFAPFTGDNGGATAPGVTGDEITIVYYEGQATDPIIAYITDAVHVDDTNGDRTATMKELVRYYETYYELYGRKVNLVTFEGTGNATDEVAAPRRRGADRPAVQAVRRVRRPGADQCVCRRTGRAQGRSASAARRASRQRSTATAIRTCGASTAVRCKSNDTWSSSSRSRSSARTPATGATR